MAASSPRLRQRPPSTPHPKSPPSIPSSGVDALTLAAASLAVAGRCEASILKQRGLEVQGVGADDGALQYSPFTTTLHLPL